MAKLSLIVDSAQGEAALKRFSKDADAVTASTDKTSLGLGRMIRGIAALGVAYKTFNLAREMVRLADSADRASRQFNVVFSDIGERANKWARDLSQALHVPLDVTQQAASKFELLFENAGLGANAAFQMTQQMVNLGQTLERLYPGATDKLIAGLSGSTETLRTMGIVINEDMIEQYALNQGWIQAGQTLSPLGRLLATYNLVLEKSTKQTEAAGQMTDTYSEQLRQLHTAWTNTKTAFGQALVGPLTEGLVKLNDWLEGNKEEVKAWAESFQQGVENVAGALHRLIDFLSSQTTIQAFRDTTNFFDNILKIPGPIETFERLKEYIQKNKELSEKARNNQGTYDWDRETHDYASDWPEPKVQPQSWSGGSLPIVLTGGAGGYWGNGINVRNIEDFIRVLRSISSSPWGQIIGTINQMEQEARKDEGSRAKAAEWRPWRWAEATSTDRLMAAPSRTYTPLPGVPEGVNPEDLVDRTQIDRVLRDLRVQLDIIGKTNEERAEALALQDAQIDKTHSQAKEVTDLARAVARARQEEQAGKVLEDLKFQNKLLHANNEERQIMLALQSAGIKKSGDMADAIAQEVKALEKTRDLRQMADEVGSAFGKAFEDIVVNGGKAGDAIDALFKDIERAVLHMLVTKPLQEAISGSIMGAFGGGTSTGGGGGGLLGGLLSWLFHGGGTVGYDAVAARMVDPLLFVGARRLHGGLLPGEYPAILKRGETVLPEGWTPSVTVNITNNSSAPVTASVSSIRMDLKRMLVGLVLEDQKTEGPITRGFAAMWR